MDNVYNEPGYAGESSISSNGGSNIMNRVRDMKDKMGEQATVLRERINEQAGQIGNQLAQNIDNARGKTSSRLRNTSQRLHNLAVYVEEHDARDISQAMMRSTRDMIRRHPGRSIAIGIIGGLLLGKALGAFRR